MSVLFQASCLIRAAIAILVFIAAITVGMPIVLAQSLGFTPPRPDGPAKIQSSLWDLVSEGQAAAKSVSHVDSQVTREPVVVILVPHPGKGSSSIDTSSFEDLGN